MSADSGENAIFLSGSNESGTMRDTSSNKRSIHIDSSQDNTAWKRLTISPSQRSEVNKESLELTQEASNYISSIDNVISGVENVNLDGCLSVPENLGLVLPALVSYMHTLSGMNGVKIITKGQIDPSRLLSLEKIINPSIAMEDAEKPQLLCLHQMIAELIRPTSTVLATSGNEGLYYVREILVREYFRMKDASFSNAILKNTSTRDKVIALINKLDLDAKLGGTLVLIVEYLGKFVIERIESLGFETQLERLISSWVKDKTTLFESCYNTKKVEKHSPSFKLTLKRNPRALPKKKDDLVTVTSVVKPKVAKTGPLTGEEEELRTRLNETLNETSKNLKETLKNIPVTALRKAARELITRLHVKCRNIEKELILRKDATHSILKARREHMLNQRNASEAEREADRNRKFTQIEWEAAAAVGEWEHSLDDLISYEFGRSLNKKNDELFISNIADLLYPFVNNGQVERREPLDEDIARMDAEAGSGPSVEE